MKTLSIIFFALAPVVILIDAHASDIRCGGRIVSVGDTNADVIMKCGEPDWKEEHKEEIIEKLDEDKKRKIDVTVEEWTYNFGPNYFMRIFKFKNGKVVDIRLGDYGYPKDEAGRFQCGEKIVSVGDTKADVIMKCGKPAWKDEREEVLREKLDEDVERKVFVTVEEWTYNFGPNYFMRIFKFRNGKLVDIKLGGYGYEEPKKGEKR